MQSSIISKLSSEDLLWRGEKSDPFVSSRLLTSCPTDGIIYPLTPKQHDEKWRELTPSKLSNRYDKDRAQYSA